jgi:hypothetical protein
MSLPPVIQLEEKKEAVPATPAFKPLDGVLQADFKLDLSDQLKKIVICTSRDISETDRDIFKSYGRVLDYDHDIHNNLRPDVFLWDYLIIDLRQGGDRYFLMKQILPFREKYNIVSYCYAVEKSELVKGADNQISAFPKRQARREDFDMILLTERVKAPSFWYSLFSCVLQTYHQVKN